MIIKSKRTGKQLEITRKEWEKMQSNGLAKSFVVISAEDTKEVKIPKNTKQFLGKKHGN